MSPCPDAWISLQTIGVRANTLEEERATCEIQFLRVKRRGLRVAREMACTRVAVGLYPGGRLSLYPGGLVPVPGWHVRIGILLQRDVSTNLCM